MRIRNAAVILAACWLGSILVGLAAYQGAIFQPHLIHFQVVASGLVGAAYLMLEQLRWRRGSLAVWVLAFVSLKFVGWAVIFGVLHFASFTFLTVANGIAFDAGRGLAAARLGGLIGLGLALGHESATRWMARSAAN